MTQFYRLTCCLLLLAGDVFAQTRTAFLGNNRLEGRELTMADFAELLTRFYDRPVIAF